MATTTFSTGATGNGQAQGNGATRRDVLRWLGGVAAAGVLGVVGANGRIESAQAKRRGKKRTKRHSERSQAVTSSAIESPDLGQDHAAGDPAFAGGRCRWRYVCYADGVCRRRWVCWY